MYLKEFRERLNLTQKELSEKISVAQTTIARYEKKQINPTSVILNKYISILNANPNYLFLKMEPVTLDNYPSLDESTLNLLNDLTMSISKDELNNLLNKILIDNLVKKFLESKNNIFTKLLNFVTLDGIFKSRPILFLYYIFQIIENDSFSNKKVIASYKEYLKNVIEDFRLFSLINQPIFTEKMKKSIIDIIDIKLTESECRLLVEHNAETLEVLESNMPPDMIRFHRNLFK